MKCEKLFLMEPLANSFKLSADNHFRSIKEMKILNLKWALKGRPGSNVEN